jgi:transcription antitermination factor NusG
MISGSISQAKYWYAVYTRSRAEKKVFNDLTLQGIEVFLPLQRKLRKWSDRKKWVEIPLMSGYCFVHITRKEYDQVLQNANVVCYITFEGKAAVIRDSQIDFLKRMLHMADVKVEVSHEKLIPGQKVEVIAGPLIGMRGELVESRGKHRFILRIEQIDTVFSVEVPEADLTPVED